MSKRAKEKALELFPIDMQMCIDNKGKPYEADVNEQRRKYVAFGYEQAEKDTIERAVNVLINFPSLVIPSNYIAYFRKKMMEEDNG